MDPTRPSALSGTPAGHLSGGPAFVPSSGLSGTPGSGRLSGIHAPTPARPPALPLRELDAVRRVDAAARTSGFDSRDHVPLAHRPLSAAPALAALRHPVGSAFLSAPAPPMPTYPPVHAVPSHPLGSMRWQDWVFSVENTGEIFSGGFDVVRVRSPEGLAVIPITTPTERARYAIGAPLAPLAWLIWKTIIESNRNPFLEGARILGFGPDREVTSIILPRT
jgi:hypothetical protein